MSVNSDISTENIQSEGSSPRPGHGHGPVLIGKFRSTTVSGSSKSCDDSHESTAQQTRLESGLASHESSGDSSTKPRTPKHRDEAFESTAEQPKVPIGPLSPKLLDAVQPVGSKRKTIEQVKPLIRDPEANKAAFYTWVERSAHGRDPWEGKSHDDVNEKIKEMGHWPIKKSLEHPRLGQLESVHNPHSFLPSHHGDAMEFWKSASQHFARSAKGEQVTLHTNGDGRAKPESVWSSIERPEITRKRGPIRRIIRVDHNLSGQQTVDWTRSDGSDASSQQPRHAKRPHRPQRPRGSAREPPKEARSKKWRLSVDHLPKAPPQRDSPRP